MSSVTIICGPTASGKSALGLEVAQNRDGVIINADSLQVYNALPLLTAQPDVADKEKIPHRLYGVLDRLDKCSAQDWRERAIAEIKTVLDQGKHPVVVGGTGLYLKTLMEGLSPIPDISPDIRARAVALQAETGNPGFHSVLRDVDPVMAERLNPNDTQRLIRAYEVMIATGQSLSVWQSKPLQGPPEGWRFHVMIKTLDRAVLHQRCDLRFDWMMDNGALDEVHENLDLPDEAPVTHALGFRPLRDYINGTLSKDEAVALAKAETRQYAKRQDTWFRHQIRPQPWVDDIQRVL